MALIVDEQQPQHKYHCRICKKGFGCGQSLGGHMRVHGICDDITNMDDDDEDQTSYELDPNLSKRMYALRNNPKISRVCENCGIEFCSWRSFFEHGKCTSNEIDLYAEESFPGVDLKEGLPKRGHEHNWSKRKRSYRANVGNVSNPNFPSSEEENLAHCLMMLSNGTVEPFFVTGTEEPCAFASKDEGRQHHLNPYNQTYKSQTQHENAKYECKACKKVFSSHQALGGHRASHKKVKGCFAAKLDHIDDTEKDQPHGMITQEQFHVTKLQCDLNGSSMKKKAKVHECSICYRVFSSGQALGGHKRCHWITSKSFLDHTPHSVVKFDSKQFYDQADGAVKHFPKDSETLDLTLDLSCHNLYAKPQSNQDSQEIVLLPWIGGEDCEKTKIYTTKEKTVDDETVTKTKFAKITELDEMNSSETSSRWLQVGLGSTSSRGGSDPY